MIRFVRVTYVRPMDDAIECATMYSPPSGQPLQVVYFSCASCLYSCETY